jgi:hypothetical protein
MCPACIATVALTAAGAASTGGLAAFVLTKLGARSGAEAGDRKPQPTEIASCNASYPETSGLPRAGSF